MWGESCYNTTKFTIKHVRKFAWGIPKNVLNEILGVVVFLVGKKGQRHWKELKHLNPAKNINACLSTRSSMGTYKQPMGEVTYRFI